MEHEEYPIGVREKDKRVNVRGLSRSVLQTEIRRTEVKFISTLGTLST